MKNQHILIVDDHEGNRALLTALLGREYHLTIACNGSEALRAVAEQSFDLILLDIMMPDINGLDVLATLRQDYDTNQLPVILISALTERAHIVEGLQAGANDYISKPFELEVVEARVATQLRLKALADEQLQLVTKLEQANQMRNRLMKMASHDLKNPINTMNMAFQLMEDIGGNDKSLLGMAKKSLKQMHNIVLEFLDMEILRDDQVAVQLETVSLDDTLQEVVDTFIFAAEQKQIKIQYREANGLIVADKKRLQQVLNNLMSNAIKYSPRGCSVAVQVECRETSARIHIIDEGEGIGKSEQTQLFQPFAKISTQPTEGEDSTGLGLWIAQQMMEVQNGAIGVVSEEGAGCDFWVELPVAEAVQAGDEVQTRPLPTPEQLRAG